MGRSLGAGRTRLEASALFVLVSLFLLLVLLH
jgi:hypothetical protein